MENELFFVRGYSINGIQRMEDLLNFHPDVNCRGDFDFEALGEFIEDFFNRNKSILIYERNPYMLKTIIISAIREMITNVCGSNFKRIGASSADSIKPLFIPNTKYIVVYQSLHEAVVSNLIYNLELAIINPALVPDKLKSIAKFNEMVNLHTERNLPLEDIIYNLKTDKVLSRVLRVDWLKSYTQDVRVSQRRSKDVHWVAYDQLFENYHSVMDRVFSFLKLPSIPKESYKENLASGYYDYPRNLDVDHNSFSVEDIKEKVSALEAEIEQFINREDMVAL